MSGEAWGTRGTRPNGMWDYCSGLDERLGLNSSIEEQEFADL
jgi:hypothetical protein